VGLLFVRVGTGFGFRAVSVGVVRGGERGERDCGPVLFLVW
jgi:hypothetical protein